MSRAPPAGSPASIRNAVRVSFVRQAASKTTQAASRILARIFALLRDEIAFTQPDGKEPQSCHKINNTRRDPHDESAELLIFERRQSPGCGRLEVGRVPDRSLEGE